MTESYCSPDPYQRTSSTNLWRLVELGLENHYTLDMVEFNLTYQGSGVRLVQRCNAV